MPCSIIVLIVNVIECSKILKRTTEGICELFLSHE